MIKLRNSAHGAAGAFSTALVVVLALLILNSMLQNILVYSTFRNLSFREVDDFAFQITLNKYHHALGNGNFREVMSANDYAYGWIYWIPISIATYPLYVLNTFFAISWPLIVFPRLLSSLSLVAMIIANFKTAKNFKLSNAASLTAAFAIVSLPPILYYSLRFGTISLILALTSWAVFYATKINGSLRRNIVLSSLFLAIAGGIKLSSLIASPLVIAVWVYTLLKNDKLSVRCRIIFLNSISILFSALILNFPPLPAALIMPEILNFFVSNLLQFGSSSANMNPSIAGMGELLTLAIKLWGWPALVVSAFGLFYRVRFQKSSNIELRTLAAALLFIIGCLLALGSFISVPYSQVSYASSISIFILFPIIWFLQAQRRLEILAIFAASALVSITIPILTSSASAGSELNLGYYWIQEQKQVAEVERAKEISKLIGLREGSAWHSTVALDYSVKTELSNIDQSNGCNIWIFDNLTTNLTQCPKDPDFFILDSFAIGFQSNADFVFSTAKLNPKRKESIQMDKSVREILLKSGTFGSSHYVLDRSIKGLLIFIKRPASLVTIKELN